MRWVSGRYKELETGALAVVCGVCVGGEREGSVCCVGMFKIACKIPESAVVRWHYIGHSFDEFFGCFWCRGYIIDE